MASAFLTLLTGALVLLCFYMYIKYTFWKRRGIPTAKGYYPIVGHLLSVMIAKENIADVFQRIYDECKGYSMVGLYKGFEPALLIREPNLVKTVLQTHFPSFHENGLHIVPEVDPLLAKNPFFNYGEPWSTGRKRLTYAFSNMRLKVLFGAVSGVCKKFEDFLTRRTGESKKCEIELKYLFQKFTGEVVANAGLGIEGYCFEDKVHPNAFDRIGHDIFQPTLIDGLVTLFSLIFRNINSLLKIRFIPEKMDRFFRTAVAENLEVRRKESTPRNDFLQLMIDLEKQGEKMDETSITAHALSFYLDGYETSSITLSFLGYQLAVHQDIQERLRNEVNSVIEKHGDVLTFDSIKEMTYMDMVLSESQRCYAALGFLHKICTDEFELEGSDGLSCSIKPGQEIIISLFGLHNDPKYWIDPDTFDPERFNDERKQSIEKMTFLPFGDGPRICVGMRMAILQVKACIATLLRHYKLELSSKTKLPLKLSPHYFLTAPVGGLWVNLSKL